MNIRSMLVMMDLASPCAHKSHIVSRCLKLPKFQDLANMIPRKGIKVLFGRSVEVIEQINKQDSCRKARQQLEPMTLNSQKHNLCHLPKNSVNLQTSLSIVNRLLQAAIILILATQ